MKLNYQNLWINKIYYLIHNNNKIIKNKYINNLYNK